MQSANATKIQPGWPRMIFLGRRPKYTLARIAVLVLCSYVVFRYVLLPIRIEGISMQPTYHTGQIKCINRLAYWHHGPQRGDIVSVRLSDPDSGNPSVLYLKRIIGRPGETVSFHLGHAYINDRLLDEPYVKYPCDWEHAPVVCGSAQYYVVGDNRSMPFELHYQGRAERDHIVGKLWL